MFILKRKTYEYKTNILIPAYVLMWKYTVTRIHRCFNSFWEIFSGVSVFLLLFFVYQSTKGETTVPKLHQLNDSVIRVLYTPDNSFTRRLISRASNYLAQNEMETGTNRQWRFEAFEFPLNENKLNNTEAVVVVDFKNMSSTVESPLNYSVDAIPGVQDNNLNKALNGFFRALITPEEVAPPHMGLLQWAIDKSYIELRIGKAIIQTVKLITIPKYISEELQTLHKFMIICTIIAPLPFFLSHSATLIMERRSGLRELMKMSGICADILRFSHILETLVIGILYCIPVIIILKITSEPMLPNSNSLIIAFTIVLHYVNTMSLSFITTALSQDFHHADCLNFLLYMSTFILDCIWYSYKSTYKFLTYVVCVILPHAPIYLFWDEVLYLESIGVGSKFRNLHDCHSDNVVSVATVWLFFYIHLAVVTSLAWYLDLVRPGPYGVSKRWDFMFKRSYWLSHKIKRRVLAHSDLLQSKREEKYFEKVSNVDIAIQVYNVSKVYKRQGSQNAMLTALDSVTFDCYQGEITLVLGANGAGKTTLMNIVAGMIGTTYGVVLINGINVTHRIMENHEDVGFCMQDNICFKFLTVKENITFFKKLQKNREDDPGFTVDQLLKKLKLYDVADNYSKQLSTGTLRCLQVACVLAVSPDVLVLDEPTTGMDVDVRHRLWDMLFVLRSKKTIIMTTSCLEEAYALADRIAILHNGVLRCHGSPSFLRDTIGMSFNVAITLKNGTQMMKLKETVGLIIPDLKVRIEDMRNIVLALPTKETTNFPKVFKTLEKGKEEFGIELIEVGMFMEEVFMTFIEKAEETYISQIDSSYLIFRSTKKVGLRLIWSRVQLLHSRIYKYMRLKKAQFLLIRVLVPVLCLVIMTLTSNYSLRKTKIFTHHVSEEEPPKEVKKLVYNVGPFRRQGLINGAEKYPGLSLVYTVDIDREFQNPTTGFSSKDVAGFKVTDRFSKIFHPRDLKSTSQSINMFSNIYMPMFLPNDTHSIRTFYEPILTNITRKNKVYEPKSTFFCMKWSIWVAILSILPLTPTIILCIVELRKGVRDNHMMAGCSPILHWGCKLSAHMMLYSAVVLAPVVIIAVLFDFDRTFFQFGFLGALTLLVTVFGLAFLSQLYLLSFFLNENLAISQIYVASLFFGVILPVVSAVLQSEWEASVLAAIIYFIIMSAGRFVPIFPFALGLARLTMHARLNAYCNLNRRKCPNLLVFNEPSFSTEFCCDSESMEPYSYFSTSESGLYDLVNLLAQFVCFFTLVILLEMRIPQYWYEQFSLMRYKPPQSPFRDPSVKREKIHVRQAIRNRNFEDDTLLVDNVHKEYVHNVRQLASLNAVKGVTFSVKREQCLAILGAQASGKSSLLNMLAGNLVMTRGSAYVDGKHIRKNHTKTFTDLKQTLHKINLSSASGGMDSFLTGHRNIMFLALMRGYNSRIAHKMAYMTRRYLGLHYLEGIVEHYSAGCLRRLSLCTSLVLGPAVAFVDEPMRSIDPVSKLLVARALQQIVLHPAALIVAETSVAWRILRPVFTRIAIMSKGQLAVIGSAQEVLESIATGYTVRIKLKAMTALRSDKYRSRLVLDEGSSGSESEDEATMHSDKSVMLASNISKFKKDFLKEFPTSRQTAEHLSMLYFYIHEEPGEQTQLYSDMFEKLQHLKENYEDVVEDYYLNATTIEDVFLRLQKQKVSQSERFRSRSLIIGDD